MCIVVAQQLFTNKIQNKIIKKQKQEVKEMFKLIMVCGWDLGRSAGKYFSISNYV